MTGKTDRQGMADDTEDQKKHVEGAQFATLVAALLLAGAQAVGFDHPALPMTLLVNLGIVWSRCVSYDVLFGGTLAVTGIAYGLGYEHPLLYIGAAVMLTVIGLARALVNHQNRSAER